LERAFRIGLTLDSTDVMLHFFTSKTKVIIEVGNITHQNKEILENLSHKMFLVEEEGSE
jgi:hypothetical protein